MCLIVLMSMFSNFALADCNFSTGIKPLPDGNYEYTKECHLAVGQLVQTNKIQLTQISELNSAIQLKDLALTQSEQRVNMWMNTVNNEQDRLNKVDQDQKHNDFIYFGLGILATIGTGFALARLTK